MHRALDSTYRDMNQTPSRHKSLRDPGRILLISCYELGHQPIGLAQPMGFLESEGYSPVSLDLAVQDLDADAIQRAYFIGISVPMHTALTLGLHLAKHIRNLSPDTHMCFYGLYASLNAQYLLEETADSVIGGEYEVPLMTLIDRLEQNAPLHDNDRRSAQSPKSSGGPPRLHGITGVSLQESLVPPVVMHQRWHTHSNERAHETSRLFPSPIRKTLPSLDRYAKLEYRGSQQLVGYVEASRGCLHRCLHCPIVPVYKGRFFLTPEQVVLDDIRQQVEMGAVHITFGDADFLNGPKHSLNILRTMHQEIPQLTFDVTTKIEHILQHREMFQEFSMLGCLFIISAVESFSHSVLHHLSKGHTQEDIFTALDILRKSDIALRPSLVAFTPWTSLDDYIDMLDLVETHDLIHAVDPVQYSVRLLVPPGSALLDPPANHTTPIHRFLTQLDQSKFQHLWVHPDPRMDTLYETVTSLVEEDSKNGVDSLDTFSRIKQSAYDAAGIPYVQKDTIFKESLSATKPPRLTEPWFCCAEPTKQQLHPLHVFKTSSR